MSPTASAVAYWEGTFASKAKALIAAQTGGRATTTLVSKPRAPKPGTYSRQVRDCRTLGGSFVEAHHRGDSLATIAKAFGVSSWAVANELRLRRAITLSPPMERRISHAIALLRLDKGVRTVKGLSTRLGLQYHIVRIALHDMGELKR